MCYNSKVKILATRKKALFDFDILEKYTGGLSLSGSEVKTIRNGKANITNAFVILRGGEAFMVGALIPAFQEKNKTTPEDRTIKVLLTKKELRKIETKLNEKGLTIVVLSLYNSVRTIKAEIAVVRGKKNFDKRETIKKREVNREIQRTLKNR